jgi:metallo-beta-lactamase family protein
MKLTFLGAARSVTGSMHLMEVNGRRILFDCGLFQGKRKEAFRLNREVRVDAEKVGAVLLSHAHIDHSGNLPNLIKQGFRGTIYATGATCDLCKIMLPDSGHLQERDVEYVNRKRRRQGKNPFEPLYTAEEAKNVTEHLQEVSYEHAFHVDDRIEVVYHDAGHILGSAMIEVRVDGMRGRRRIVFSGDVGRPDQPILRDPWPLCETDVLIMESTYGGRSHEGSERIREKLLRVLQKAVQRKGKVIIPAFSVGRTQHLVYELHQLFAEGKLPPISIFVDSPLSVNATEVFRAHPECYDKEVLRFLSEEKDPFGFSRLRYVRELDDSKRLNTHPGPVVIISASGMCEGGRILHHLANAVGDSRNTILIVGFQAENTLGRRLVERRETIKIFGEEHELKAEVETINAFSAHADQGELLSWVEHAGGRIGKIFLVHGEEEQAAALTGKLAERGLYNVVVPEPGSTWEV